MRYAFRRLRRWTRMITISLKPRHNADAFGCELMGSGGVVARGSRMRFLPPPHLGLVRVACQPTPSCGSQDHSTSNGLQSAISRRL